MRDLYHNVLITQVFSPANSTVTRTSASVDLQGFNSANVVFAVGQSGDTLSGSVYWTLTMQHSDDNSTFTAVTATDCEGGTNSVIVNSSSLDRTAYALGYNGAKRYLQAVATPTGTMTVGTPIGMISMKGRSSYAPVVTP